MNLHQFSGPYRRDKKWAGIELGQAKVAFVLVISRYEQGKLDELEN